MFLSISFRNIIRNLNNIISAPNENLDVSNNRSEYRSFFENDSLDQELNQQNVKNTSCGENNFISKIKKIFGFKK